MVIIVSLSVNWSNRSHHFFAICFRPRATLPSRAHLDAKRYPVWCGFWAEKAMLSPTSKALCLLQHSVGFKSWLVSHCQKRIIIKLYWMDFCNVGQFLFRVGGHFLNYQPSNIIKSTNFTGLCHEMVKAQGQQYTPGKHNSVSGFLWIVHMTSIYLWSLLTGNSSRWRWFRDLEKWQLEPSWKRRQTHSYLVMFILGELIVMTSEFSQIIVQLDYRNNPQVWVLRKWITLYRMLEKLAMNYIQYFILPNCWVRLNFMVDCTHQKNVHSQ